MSTVRAGQPGATRVCPHCKATVLESAAICPGCRHHLRFNGSKPLGAGEGYSALSIDSTLAHKVASEPCEYCVVLDIRNERGEQVLRQVVGVGALQAGEKRRLTVSVEMQPVVAQALRPAASAATRPPPPPLTPPGLTPRPAAPSASSTGATAAGATAAGATRSGVAAPGATASAAAPSRAPGAVPAPGAAALPGAAAGKSPTAARPGMTAVPASPRKPSPPGPGPGGALAQRLRIFRKP